jgi:uncharacterized RDD family membrane protein YckC
MLCVRCSHLLPPRADRCLRCFALNPQNRVAAPAAQRAATPLPPVEVSFESDPPGEARELSIVSEPPAGEVRVTFDDERAEERAGQDPHEAVTDPPDVGERWTAAARTVAPNGSPSRDARPAATTPTRTAKPTANATPMASPARTANPTAIASPTAGSTRTANPTAIASSTALANSTRTPSSTPAATAMATQLESPSRSAPNIPLDDSRWTLGPSSPPAPSDPSFGPSGSDDAWVDLAELSAPHAARSSAPSSAPSAARSPAPSAARSPAPHAARSPAPLVVTLHARLLAWSVDLSLVALCSAAHVAVATALLDPAALAPRGSGSADYWLDLLLSHRLAFLWVALSAMLALAYSWLFATLGGRTPGMALAGLRLQSVRGGAPTPAVAFARAAWAIPSAALGLVGFALALFDRRGQTLHDKLTGTLVVASD